jgi:hypothetical protein
MLARYRQKPNGSGSARPPTLWVALGTRGKRVGFDPPKEGGVESILGDMRLGDTLDLAVMIEANNRMETFGAWNKIVQFARRMVQSHPADKRFERLASLISQATPDRPGEPQTASTFVGRWSSTIDADQLTEWFAPFWTKR